MKARSTEADKVILCDDRGVVRFDSCSMKYVVFVFLLVGLYGLDQWLGNHVPAEQGIAR